MNEGCVRPERHGAIVNAEYIARLSYIYFLFLSPIIFRFYYLFLFSALHVTQLDREQHDGCICMAKDEGRFYQLIQVKG